MQHEREFWLKREFLTDRFISSLPRKTIVPFFWRSLKMGWSHHCLVAESFGLVKSWSALLMLWFQWKTKSRLQCTEIIYDICKALIIYIFIYCSYLLTEFSHSPLNMLSFSTPDFFPNHVLIMSHHFMTKTLLHSDFITVKKQCEFTAEEKYN